MTRKISTGVLLGQGAQITFPFTPPSSRWLKCWPCSCSHLWWLCCGKHVGKKHKMKTKKCSNQHTPSSWHKHNVNSWITKQQCSPFSLSRIFYTDIYMLTQERLWGLVNHHLWYISTYMILPLQSDRDNEFCCWNHRFSTCNMKLNQYSSLAHILNDRWNFSNKLYMSLSVLADQVKNCNIPLIIIIFVRHIPSIVGWIVYFLIIDKVENTV